MAANSPTFVTDRARLKHTELKAKEKAENQGQRPNMIDGVWHCSNCGCPDSLAIGRRKGPLGDKSQCGSCGKHWHQYRKPLLVEYNTSYEFHANRQKEAEVIKRGRPPNSTLPATPVDTSEPQTPRESRQSREASPVSTTSSASEVPLAQRLKTNSSPLVQQHGTDPAPTTPAAPVTQPSAPPPNPDPVVLPPKPTQPPQWLMDCMGELQNEWKNDRFEVICKVNETGWEWRIKCLDCPGKVYITGPGETLNNYELHLRNRLHRQKATERMRNNPNLSVS